MTSALLQHTLANVQASALGHQLSFDTTPTAGGWLLQVGAYLPDNTAQGEDRRVAWQGGGKLYISQHATHHELVLKCWQAVAAFVIHELRESFFYRGQPILQPHVNVDELARFQAATSPVYRQETPAPTTGH
jgi:hypothetical protein